MASIADSGTKSLRCLLRRYLLKDEDFSYKLDIFYGGLGISKLQFLDPHRFRIRIRVDQKCWIQIRIRIETNADPQHLAYGPDL
jgi:hypothetical protein